MLSWGVLTSKIAINQAQVGIKAGSVGVTLESMTQTGKIKVSDASVLLKAPTIDVEAQCVRLNGKTVVSIKANSILKLN